MTTNNNNNTNFAVLKIRELIFWAKICTESVINSVKRVTSRKQVMAPVPAPGSLEGKVVLITGANRGLGLEMSTAFARLGARVLIGCRDPAAGKEALVAIRGSIDSSYQQNVSIVPLDLASFESIRNCARQVASMTPVIDILVNNASIMMTAEARSVDGIELQFATNYLGHYLLTNLLLDRLRASKQARVLNLSSISHQAYLMNFANHNLVGIYTPLRAYSQSKLAVILFTREMARRLGPSSKVTTYAIHPGLIKTKLYNNESWFSRTTARYFGVGMITPWEGIQTVLYCALEPHLAQESGHYYA